MLCVACAAAAEFFPSVALGQKHAPQRERTDERAKPADDGPSSWRADISLGEEYRLRVAEPPLVGATGALGEPSAPRRTIDQDARFLVDAEVTGPEEHFRSLLSGALYWDLDGAARPGAPNFFAEQTDPDGVWWAVYNLSVEWANSGQLDYVRAGRQTSEHGLPITFDGLAIEGRPFGRKVSLFAFGGQTVHFFETQPGLLENWVASVGTTLRPDARLHFEADWRTLQDRAFSTEKQADTVLTHSYGLTAAKRFDDVSSKVFVRGLDNQLSHLGTVLVVAFPSARMGFDVRGTGQLVTLGEVAESENPFYSMLGPSLPNVRYRFEAWKEFGLDRLTTLAFRLGWRGRQLIGYAERPFNRNLGGLYFQTQFDDLGTKGLFLSGIAEWTFRPGQGWHDSFLVLGGSTGYGGGSVKTEVGTYYQQYKVRYYQLVDELQDTRTVYGMLAYRLLPELEFRARYDFELLDRYVQTMTIGLRQNL